MSLNVTQPFNTVVLQNNIVLNSQVVTTCGSVAIGFWFLVGSKNETKQNRGITHFTEHMLFKGTKTRSFFDISYAFEAVGGYVNAFTDKENICLYCTVPAKNALDALQVLCDLTTNSVFPLEQIEKERSVIQNEIISYKDDAEETGFDCVSKVIWKDKALAQDIAGDIKDIAKINRDMLLEWYKKYIQNGVLWVCVAGDFAKDNFIKELQKLPCHTPLPSFTNMIKSQKDLQKDLWNAGLYFEKADFLQTQVYFCVCVPYPLTLQDYLLWTLFDSVAGGSVVSRLFQNLREEGGLCYNVYSQFTFYKTCGWWAVYACCNKKDAYTVTKKMLLCIKDFVARPFCQKELDYAKQHTIGEETLLYESMEYRAKKMDRDYFFSLPYLTPKDLEAQINKITLYDLNMAAKRLLSSYKTLVVYSRVLSLLQNKKIKNLWKMFLCEC